MIDRILLLIPIFATIAFGTMTLVMGFLSLRKLTDGRIKMYGTVIWYALIFFSIGGGIHIVQELFNYESIMGVSLVYFEYFFYAVYYISLLYAILSLYRMAKFTGFSQRKHEIQEAMEQMSAEGVKSDS
ncbi:MAG: hypothetical protein K0A89_05240 [ANME-2 cluster archaeon]|nr:hypothetical protein [ANME-2 cluster archaeon]